MANLTLQGILKKHLQSYKQNHPLDPRRLAVCGHINDCRTAALGGLQLQCDHCDDQPVHYFSCRDRHCPQCQQHASVQWSEKQQQNLLPVTYFHLVFTLPDSINAWAQLHPEIIYRLLFIAVWETLKAFGQDPKRLNGQLGATLILHTWGQNLSQHLHLHCLVPGGAMTAAGEWNPAKGNYLFPVRALSHKFRGNLVSQLRKAHQNGELTLITHQGEPSKTLDKLMEKPWVVYSRPGLSNPESVLDYLARYTHRTAINNSRLLADEEDQICFRYKDYRDNNKQKVMTLPIEEFIRRFLLHVLPKGLKRIRHYGFLSNASRKKKLAIIRTALAAPQPEPEKKEEAPSLFDGYLCPKCKIGMLHIIAELPAPRWKGG